MAVLDALGDRLVSEGVGALGSTVFLARQPDNPDACVTLLELTGFDNLHTYGDSVATGYRPRVRAYCRAGKNDYPTARALAEQVQQALGNIRAETISGVDFRSVLDTSGVYPLSVDVDDRPTLIVDFVAWVPA